MLKLIWTDVFKKGRGTWHFWTHMVWFILPKKSSFVSSGIIAQDPTEIRNPKETLLLHLGPILKKLIRDPKA